jgi:hypothetical protein
VLSLLFARRAQTFDFGRTYSELCLVAA